MLHFSIPTSSTVDYIDTYGTVDQINCKDECLSILTRHHIVLQRDEAVFTKNITGNDDRLSCLALSGSMDQGHVSCSVQYRNRIMGNRHDHVHWDKMNDREKLYAVNELFCTVSCLNLRNILGSKHAKKLLGFSDTHRSILESIDNSVYVDFSKCGTPIRAHGLAIIFVPNLNVKRIKRKCNLNMELFGE